MAKDTRFWLAIGTPENWHTAFDYQGIWGLKPSQRRYWERMTENQDLVFFYATSPVSGVVGFGIVRTKLLQNSPLWPSERAENKVVWPLRFEFDVMSALPPAAWKDSRVALEELKSRARSGFQEIEPRLAEELLRALPSNVPNELVLMTPLVARGPGEALPPAVMTPQIPTDLHDRCQWLMAEIGRMQKFVADTEYPIENRRLDVVWRRVQRSVPSYVFEVQVGGNITEALAKLKQAHELWNSNTYVLGKEEHRPAVTQLLGGTFHEMRDRVKFVEISQVEDLYERKRAYRDLENKLSIFA